MGVLLLACFPSCAPLRTSWCTGLFPCVLSTPLIQGHKANLMSHGRGGMPEQLLWAADATSFNCKTIQELCFFYEPPICPVYASTFKLYYQSFLLRYWTGWCYFQRVLCKIIYSGTDIQMSINEYNSTKLKNLK